MIVITSCVDDGGGIPFPMGYMGKEEVLIF